MSDNIEKKFARGLLQSAKWSLCLAIIGFVGRHVWRHWQAVNDVDVSSPGWLLAGSVMALLALVLAVRGCQRLITAHGCQISYERTLGLYYVPMLGKYIPGKVWSVVAAVHFYGRQGIPKRVAATCLTLYMALGLASAALVTLVLGLPMGESNRLLWPCMAVVAALLVGVYPPIFYRVINLALQAFGRNRIETTVSLAGILRVMIILIVAKLAYGTGFFLLIQSFHSTSWEKLPPVISLFTFAQVAGLVAVFAPAGIGVREGVLLLGLQPIVGPGPAIVITGVCRLWQTGIELVMAGVGWWALQHGKDTCTSAEGGENGSAEPRSNDADSPTSDTPLTCVARGQDRVK